METRASDSFLVLIALCALAGLFLTGALHGPRWAFWAAAVITGGALGTLTESLISRRRRPR